MDNGVCTICGIPADTEFFDDSRIVDFPEAGQQVILAAFQIPPQYCGVLENFAQVIIKNGKYNEQIDTPGLEWVLLRNGQPFYPYLKFEYIVNPWGYNNYPVTIRLDENAKIEFIVRNREFQSGKKSKPEKIGARISGRYWYNRAYGGNGKIAGCEVLGPVEGQYLHVPRW